MTAGGAGSPVGMGSIVAFSGPLPYHRGNQEQGVSMHG